MANWTPAEITTELWFDADDATTITVDSGNDVSQWDDKSGNARNLTRDVGALKPYTSVQMLNSKNVIQFRGVSMSIADGTFLNGKTSLGAIVVLDSNNGLIENRGIFASNEAASDNGFSLRFDAAGFAGGGTNVFKTAIETTSSVNALETSNGSATLDPTILAMRWDAGVGARNRINGDADIASGGSSTGTGTTADNSVFKIGWSPTGALLGNVAELIVFDGLSDKDVEKLEGYLAHKWGLAANLPVDHLYKAAAPTLANDGEYRIDTNHALAGDLYAAVVADDSNTTALRELVTNLQVTLPPEISIQTRADGKNVIVRSATSAGIPLPNGAIGSRNITIVGVQSFKAASDVSLLDFENQKLVLWADVSGGTLRPAAFGGAVSYAAYNDLPLSGDGYVDGTYSAWGAQFTDTAGNLSVQFWSNGVKNGTLNSAFSTAAGFENVTNVTFLGNYTDTTKSNPSALEMLLVFDRALNDTEMASILADPYQFVNTGGGGTVTVENSFGSLWNIYQQATGSVEARWSILQSVANSTRIDWSLLQQVVANNDVNWSIFNSVNGQLQIDWNAFGLVAGGVGIDWNLLQAASTTLQLDWSVLQQAQSGVELRFNVLQQAQQNLGIQYNIRATVDRSFSILWDNPGALNSVNSSLAIEWSILNAVTAALETEWNLLQSLGVSLELRHNIAQQVAQAIDVQYSVLNSVASNVELSWNSIAQVNGALELDWSIQIDGFVSSINTMVVTRENRVMTVLGENRVMKIQ